MQVKRLTACLALALGLPACSLMQSENNSQEYFLSPPGPELVHEDQIFTPAQDCGGTLTNEQRVYLELVHKMEKQGQYYAALAHIDELEKQAESPQTFYLRAEALRQLGQTESAAKFYQLLLGGCMTGYGLHGLGLLATTSGHLDEAETYLKHACRERPVDADIHNDYGMVLMLHGRYAAARQEFLTAIQLAPNNPLPQNNLVVLLLAENNNEEALRIAEKQNYKEEELERLSQRAEKLKQKVSTKPSNIPLSDVGHGNNDQSSSEIDAIENGSSSTVKPESDTEHSEARPQTEQTDLADNEQPATDDSVDNATSAENRGDAIDDNTAAAAAQSNIEGGASRSEENSREETTPANDIDVNSKAEDRPASDTENATDQSAALPQTAETNKSDNGHQQSNEFSDTLSTQDGDGLESPSLYPETAPAQMDQDLSTDSGNPQQSSTPSETTQQPEQDQSAKDEAASSKPALSSTEAAVLPEKDIPQPESAQNNNRSINDISLPLAPGNQDNDNSRNTFTDENQFNTQSETSSDTISGKKNGAPEKSQINQ